jgi:hypothetical protein
MKYRWNDDPYISNYIKKNSGAAARARAQNASGEANDV